MLTFSSSAWFPFPSNCNIWQAIPWAFAHAPFLARIPFSLPQLPNSPQHPALPLRHPVPATLASWLFLKCIGRLLLGAFESGVLSVPGIFFTPGLSLLKSPAQQDLPWSPI